MIFLYVGQHSRSFRKVSDVEGNEHPTLPGRLAEQRYVIMRLQRRIA